MISLPKIIRNCAILLGAVAAVPLAAQDSPPPISVYGELPRIEDATISRTGAFMAFVATVKGERLILVLGSDLKVIKTFGVGDAKVRSISFVGDESLLLISSQTEDLGRNFIQDQYEFYQGVVIPLDDNREIFRIFDDKRRTLNAVFGSYGVRPNRGGFDAYFGGLEYAQDSTSGDYVFDHGRPALFRVDLRNGKSKKVEFAPSSGSRERWLVSADGEVAATFQINTSSGSWKIINARGNRIAEGRNPDGNAGFVGLGHDGNTVIYRAELDDQGETPWYEVPLDGSAAPVEFLPDVGTDRVYWDAATGRLLGYLESGPTIRPVFYNPGHQDAAEKIIQAFPQQEMRMVEWTPDFSHVLVRTSGNGDAGSWFYVDVANLAAKFVAAERPLIPAQQVGQISTVDYTASDGLKMNGILTLPPGREAENLPVIMLPHGGPHSHDTEQFDWLPQAFASRGYAVFQPNFRGSTGRSEAFVRAGYGQWGRAMQTDISDGLTALAEAGIVDPDRACIVGASYGGYAALAGVTLQQGLYRCAVSVAGVSDLKMLKSFEREESGRSRLTRRSLEEEFGPNSGLDEVSPYRFADRADAPVMLIHGRDDTVVEYAQSYKMADALKDEGKPYELVELEEEDHWLSRSSTRQQMLDTAMRFVLEHNPPD